MHTITAVIPVRAGSKRLPNKNILPFGDSNLLIHKIRQLKQVPEIDNIVVSSDSDIMLEMAKNEGVLTHKRDAHFCDDTTLPHRHVAENVQGDHILWAVCVCPLLTPESYSNAIKAYKEFVIEKKLYDSLVSMRLFKEYLWDENGPLNYKLGSGHVISQNLPDWYIVTNGIYMLPRKLMIEKNYFLGDNPYKFVVSKREAVDIDDAEDFAVAASLYDYYNNTSDNHKKDKKAETLARVERERERE